MPDGEVIRKSCLLFFCREEIDKLTESVVKYCDYLEYNRKIIAEGRKCDQEPVYDNMVFELPVAAYVTVYRVERERKVVDGDPRGGGFLHPSKLDRILVRGKNSPLHVHEGSSRKRSPCLGLSFFPTLPWS